MAIYEINLLVNAFLNGRFRFHSNSTNHLGIKILGAPECNVSGTYKAWDEVYLTFSDSFVPLSSLKNRWWAFTSLASKVLDFFVAHLFWFLCTCVCRWGGEKEQLLWTESSNFRFDLCPGSVSWVQEAPGYGGWAQWHSVRCGAFWGPRLAGLHLYTADGDDTQKERGEAAVQEHRPRSASWDICGEVKMAVIQWPKQQKGHQFLITEGFALMSFWYLYTCWKLWVETDSLEWEMAKTYLRSIIRTSFCLCFEFFLLMLTREGLVWVESLIFKEGRLIHRHVTHTDDVYIWNRSGMLCWGYWAREEFIQGVWVAHDTFQFCKPLCSLKLNCPPPPEMDSRNRFILPTTLITQLHVLEMPWSAQSSL